MQRFDIIAKTQDDCSDFDMNGAYIVGKPKSKSGYVERGRRGEDGGYYFSQRQTLESVDLACASKYRKGIRDEEGQRKTFMNVVNFYRDVTKMKINVNVSNYLLQPTSLDFTWPVWLMDRKFKQWAQENDYDDQIDEFANDLATYGTVVVKRLKNTTERVPLRTLRNTQTAKSLQNAAENGGYVIIENEFHYNEMKKYPGWDITGLAKNKKYVVYERYALVPKGMLKTWKEDTCYEGDDDEMVLAMAILAPEAGAGSAKDTKKGKILFMEKIEKIPLEECHSDKVDGRWLGKGEVEKQLENQIARNLTANLRRRGLLWATKKIYQSADDEVQKNLVMEVKDGDVLKVKPNMQISQVNTQTQQLNDFTQDEQAWEQNSMKISFAFNAATGENMPSGTSFSLGVMLSKTVASHFSLIRDTYSNFLKRSFFDQLIPIFQKEFSDAHTLHIAIGESDIEHLKESIMVWHVNQRIFEKVLSGNMRIDKDSLRSDVESEMLRNPYLFINMGEDAYKNPHYYMKLNINDDIGPDVASLTSLYQAMAAKGDPRAEQVLKRIFSIQGKALDDVAGATPKPVAPVVPGQGGAPSVPSPVSANPAAPVVA